jgi:hypothetical protein
LVSENADRYVSRYDFELTGLDVHHMRQRDK